MQLHKKLILFAFLIMGISSSVQFPAHASFKEYFSWAWSFASFKPALWYNKYCRKGVCSFNCILAPYSAAHEAKIVIGPNKEILLVADGKKAPLYLGDIPQSVDRFIDLRLALQIPDNHGLIALHTLNRGFEQWLADLHNSIEKDGEIMQYNYSTTDFTAPSLIDLIRGVYNLSLRDARGEVLAYVHCKSGIGRSATLVIAYLLYIYSIAKKVNRDGSPYEGTPFTDDQLIDALIAYTKKLRPVIDLHKAQKQVLKQFYTELTKYGDFATLYKHYEKAIQKRDLELKSPYTQPLTV